MTQNTIKIDVGGPVLSLTGGHAVYLDGLKHTDWQNHKLLEAAKTLPRNFTYLDVGANIGATALAIAALFPEATIFAFEPVPTNLAHLRQNIASNRIENCHVIASAIGDARSTVTITDNGPWSAILEKSSGVKVPVITLDDFCRQSLGTRKVDLLKIDVEGYEPKVLRGAARTLREMRPLLVMEFNSWTLVEQEQSPVQFAKMIFENFEVTGDEASYADKPDRFVHDNIVHHGCIDDLVMRPKQGLPQINAFTMEIDQLHAELEAMKTSTSWRITTPIRSIKTLFLKLLR
ncbi:MAG: FkbM family methyltransferase [Acidiphilium sp.]|nr:FkbM family methyltransferase [Acidiphilium sp.]MDD4936901.1 FkbM family methyltransferase [Acidiphilium sp.]